MHYKIYLINLDRSTDRLVAMQAKFAELNLYFERIEATDGRAMSAHERQIFATHRPRDKGWLPGAIGCFLSHYHVWQKISEGEAEFGVVFEDDVHLSARLPFLLEQIGQCIHEVDIVRLEGTTHRVLLDQSKKFQLGDSAILGVDSETWGAGGYILPKRVAQLLLLEPTGNHSPVDYFLFDKESSAVAKRCRIFQIIPAVCVQAKFDAVSSQVDISYGSEIEHNSEDTAIRYLFRSVGWRIRGLINMMRGYRRIRLAEDMLRK